MTFSIDSRITDSSVWVGDLKLSSLYIKNNQHFPWLILVPRVVDVKELFDLPIVSQHHLMDEINEVSQSLQHYTQADKLNIGALGNIVSQLHIHVIARFEQDLLWPHSLWQQGLPDAPYQQPKLQEMLLFFRKMLIFAAV